VRALRWDGIRLALARDVPEPVPAPGEALVRVHLAGICRTDLEITRGYLGFRGTPGHEWVGHVVAAEEADLVGSRVVGEINFACGVCPTCVAGLGRHCPVRRVLGIVGADGAFADLVLLPARNLHRVPDSVPDRAAVFTEPLAAAFEVLEQVPVGPGLRAVVLGDGKLGLLVAQVLAGAGARSSSSGTTRRSSRGRGVSGSRRARRPRGPTSSWTRRARPEGSPRRSRSSARAGRSC